MRELFDQRLTDPTIAEVVEAIVAAEEAANAGHTSGNLVRSGSSAPAIAARVLAESEGMNGHFGSANRPTNIARLSVGWWTNSAGRKFVRVRSWREWSRRYGWDGFQTAEFDQTERDRHRRPGVWQVDHERVIEASSGGEPEWVAVCGCGAAGSPASLAWQHGMCGPCADRIAEFGPDAVKHAPGLLADTDFEPTDVVFSPGGKYIVAVGGEGYCLWDPASGMRRLHGTRPTPNEEARPAVSSDGKFIFLGDGVARLTLLDVNDRFSLIEVPAPPVLAAHWSKWPGVLIVQCIGGSAPFSLVKVLSAQSADFQSTTPQPTYGTRLVAVHPDGQRVVFADQHRASVARLTREGALTTETQFNLGDGRLNRTGMWQDGPTIVRFTPDGERLLFIRGAEMELRLPARPKALLQATFPQPIRDAAFSPDYEHLFILGTDGIIYVCNPGTLTSVRARLRWHFWPPSRLAVSPDGQTLATAGPEGVKLWPVAQLMPLM